MGFTKVDFAKPAASTFDFTPPKGAKVTEGDKRETRRQGRARSARARNDLAGGRPEEELGGGSTA